jgi:hypothetical protein
VEVRAAQREEASAICAVLRRSIAELCGVDHRNDQQVLEIWLANKTPEMVEHWIANNANSLIVAVEGDAIRGVGCVDKAGEIMLNYVSPDGSRVSARRS